MFSHTPTEFVKDNNKKKANKKPYEKTYNKVYQIYPWGAST